MRVNRFNRVNELSDNRLNRVNELDGVNRFNTDLSYWLLD
jgi:hypothetical protein